MKLNLKVRFKNEVFVVAFAAAVLAFIYQLLGMFGVVPGVTQDEIMQVIKMLLDILVMLGVLVDPTTKGVTDSDRAMTYDEPQ